MSAHTLILWTVAGFLGLSVAMMLIPAPASVSSLEDSLGSPILIEAL